MNSPFKDFEAKSETAVDTSWETYALDASPLPTFRLDPSTRALVSFNKTAAEVIAASVLDGIPEDFLASFTPSETALPPHAWKATPNKVRTVGEWSYTTTKGDCAWANLSVFFLQNAHLEQLFLYVQPLQTAKYSKAVGERTEQRIVEMLQEMQEACCILDSNYCFNFLNKSFEEIIKLKSPDVIGKCIWDLFPDTRGTIFYEKYTYVMENRLPVSFKEYSLRNDCLLNISVYPYEKGIIVYAQDVTAEKRANELFHQTERDLQSLIDSSPDNIWYMNTSLEYLYGNKSFVESFKAVTQILPIKGETIKRYLPDALNAFQRPYYDKALKGEFVEYTLETLTKDGLSRHLRFNINPIFDDSGTVIGLGCFAHDFTEQEQTNLQLETQNAKLRQISWSQSHMVRGPLARILGLIHVFDKENASNPFNTEVIAHLYDVCKELDEAIHAIVKETYLK